MSEAKFKVDELIKTPVGYGKVKEIETRKAGTQEIFVYSVLVGGYGYGEIRRLLFTESKLRKVEP